jgi:hypothetical protein
MAEQADKSESPTKAQQAQQSAIGLLWVVFIINTYPNLQPFLEMAVLILEGVYEHVTIRSNGLPSFPNAPLRRAPQL